MTILKNLKHLTIIVFLVSVSSVQAHNEPQQSSLKSERFTGTESEAYQVIRSFHQALKSKDKKLARSLLLDKVVIFEGGKVERSAQEYANHHMQADMNYLSSVKSTLIEQHVEEIGDVAVAIARTKTTGTYKGKSIERSGMETMILKKQHGVWKITHIHWSN